MKFGAEQWLPVLWAAPAAAGLAWFAIARRRSDARKFIESGLLSRLAPGRSVARLVVKAGLIVLALVGVGLALARPQWNFKPEQVKTRGRDVCFVIDVSRSMLAEDLAPSRLEKAKLWVKDALSVVKGDRIALVAFAGEAVVKCPLTVDYGFFRNSLTDLSPGSVSRGGTNIGDAIRLACKEVFNEKDTNYKDIILITDGEDHESFPVQAAESAGEQGARIIAIGIGDEATGKPIPITGANGKRENLTYNGEVVLSKLDGEMLKSMALASKNGKYFNVSTGTIELDSVYARLVKEAEQRATHEKDVVRFEEQFQIFLGVALGLLLMESLVRERGRTAS